MVREWRAKLLASGVSESMTAKAYRLLRAVLMTAVKEDEILPRNPCQIKGADQEKPAERPVLTLGQVITLAAEMPDRYRALVLVATFACRRWGEVAALERQNINTDTGTVRIRQSYTEVRGEGVMLGPPKSRAGRRTVSVPPIILSAIREHLAGYVGNDPTSLVFTTPAGRPIWRGNLNKLLDWSTAVEKLNKPGLHFHDLRQHPGGPDRREHEGPHHADGP